MADIPMALQLYSIREDCAADLAGVLQEVASMGYDGVEFAGFHGHDADAVKAMLADAGLRVAGAHVGLPALLNEWAETVAFHKAIGNEFLVVPGLPEERRANLAAWKETAGIFNQLAEKAAGEGMRVGYHNHAIEFTEEDGECPWDVFFANTRGDVIMQLDSGNALHGGVDVTPYVERYPGRAVTVHLKEFSATNDKALIGEGDVPWGRLFELCESVGGTTWYIVEQETYPVAPMECARRCRDALRAMGK